MTTDDEVIRAAIRAMRQKSQQLRVEPIEAPPIQAPLIEQLDALFPVLPKESAEVVKAITKVRSKKSDVAKLPKTWRSQLFAATKPPMGKVSRLSAAVAMLWATGCRPVELEKGIKISMVDGVLVVHILGGKHGLITNEQGTFERGLEWRTLKINPKLNKATEYLAQIAADGKDHLVSYNKNSLRTRINELGRTIQAKKKDPISISPYTFRHAMGSDIKSCDRMTDEEKSMVMGHLSCDSLQVYGRRRHGGGGVSPVQSVEASNTPTGEYVSGYEADRTLSKTAKPP